MKIVVNHTFGGYWLSDLAANLLGCESNWEANGIPRNDERLVALVENKTPGIEEMGCRLGIVEIPSDCTDWEIFEYDGAEHVIYVRNGKITHAWYTE